MSRHLNEPRPNIQGPVVSATPVIAEPFTSPSTTSTSSEGRHPIDSDHYRSPPLPRFYGRTSDHLSRRRFPTSALPNAAPAPLVSPPSAPSLTAPLPGTPQMPQFPINEPPLVIRGPVILPTPVIVEPVLSPSSTSTSEGHHPIDSDHYRSTPRPRFTNFYARPADPIRPPRYPTTVQPALTPAPDPQVVSPLAPSSSAASPPNMPSQPEMSQPPMNVIVESILSPSSIATTTSLGRHPIDSDHYRSPSQSSYSSNSPFIDFYGRASSLDEPIRAQQPQRTSTLFNEASISIPDTDLVPAFSVDEPVHPRTPVPFNGSVLVSIPDIDSATTQSPVIRNASSYRSPSQPNYSSDSVPPNFTGFYGLHTGPPSPRAPSVDESIRPRQPRREPQSTPMSAPLSNNPLPPLPIDVWNISPYRPLLQELPMELLEELSGRQNHSRAQSTSTIHVPAPGPSGMFSSGSSSDTSFPASTNVPSRVPSIKFDHTGEFAGFVNHSNHRVIYRNKMYPTASHLLEAMKFTHRPELQERIRTCEDVNDMYPLSASFQEHVRPDWGQVFLQTMQDVLFLKFKQHPGLRTLLLRTGLVDIVYADENTYWGEGRAGEGANELGKTLMRVRERLRQEGER
ncbi:hypothetical protein JVU11DRAFT_1973 [Chiua virens]|nr:hypothetical protein JVU11DRAFT_1973 [Chiua virens]